MCKINKYLYQLLSFPRSFLRKTYYNYIKQVCIVTKYLSNDIENITKDIWSNYTHVEDPPWRLSHNSFFMHCHSCESTNPESFKGFYFYDSLIFIVLGQTPWRNSRNRITNYSCSKPDLFSYNLTYYANSNIYTQSFTGQYKNSFSNQDNLSTSFTYDKSNRLLNANFTHTSDNTFDLSNTFDPDGNILTIQRYGSNNNLLDNFSYVYYSGTNRLKRVSGSSDQFTYDYNGNQTNDYINNNTGIKYDHRNLITEFTRQDLNQDPPIIDITRYKYDEAGNRIRKTIYRSNDSNPPPLPEENEDLPTGWSITKDEYYSRDASGKEIAVYQSYNLDYWNVWGTGNEGRIKSTGMKYFYLKDHLGSIRAVINQNNVIVQAQDYDPWGHIARSWDTTSADYKFTGKEHDKESNYDYFGARYYDARVGRWGQMEPLLEKYLSFSPYQYGLLNPMRLVDADGLDLYVGGDKSMALVYLQSLVGSESAYRLTMDDNGKVGFNTEGLSFSTDAAYNLLNEMVNVSKNNFLFEVASKTEGFTRALGSNERGDVETLNAEDISGDHRSGVFNFSKTQKMKDYIANYDYLPKIGFDGQVTLGYGHWLTVDGKYFQPKSNIIFHELAENYYRTEKGKYYVNTSDQKEGAHFLSIKLAEKFRKQEGKAGEGCYVPYK